MFYYSPAQCLEYIENKSKNMQDINAEEIYIYVQYINHMILSK